MKIKPRAQVLLAATALALAGLAATVPGAQAATGGAATPAVPALHGARIALGATANLYANAFAEAPNGTVFFSRGAVVYVVNGNRAPAIKLHAGRTVLALAATNADLFVGTGRLVTEYNRGNNKQVRHWTLTSDGTPTSSGLYVVGSTVWAWTDPATDESGFQYAQVDRMQTSSAAVRVVDKWAFPGDESADAAGLYFETAHGGAADDLAHANPTTNAVQYRKAPVDAPLALAAGRVDLLVFGDSGASVDSYNANTLALVSSKRIPEKDDSIEGTALGLLVLAQPCSTIPCKSATVGRLTVATGATSGALATPGAYQQLNGPAQAVIEASGVSGTHASLFLVRISS
jgi:hypothetical protein